MATKLATGISKGEDSEKVAKEAVAQAKEKLDRVDFSMVYCSSKYDYQKVVNVVRAATNKAPLIGCSTAGEFTEDKVEKGSIAVGLISSDEIKIRWPVSINEDGSLNFTCGIAEGSVFRIMDGSNLENQINAVEEAATIAKQNAENAGYSDFAGILVFECVVRQLMLGDRFSESVDRFKRVFPGVPILGWETYGEIRLDPGQFSGFHNTTSVILLLPNAGKK